MPTKPTGRPRGRPKGVKNKPKTLEAFVTDSLANPVSAPPRKPKTATRGPWAKMTPEERKAYSATIRAKRRPESYANVGRKPGVPFALTAAQAQELAEQQNPEIQRILKKMAEQGQLPDDPRAVEALEETLKVLRSEATAKDKLGAARLLLDFTKAKPTARIEHTVRTAEDFLDEIADEAENT